MADFKTVLLNKAALVEALSSLNVGESMKAKENIDHALESGALKLPSESLLQMLEQEGLSLSDFEVKSDAPVQARKPRNNKLENQSFIIVNDKPEWIKGRAVSTHRDAGDTIYKYDDLPQKYKAAAEGKVKAG
ncbi:hypothetical protein [Moritella viscosa]|uniref:Uncharacterized protein n=1 Tax=Moritella viscosa TaxID=80854 RepID=A0ABY1HFA8_9GAMM|nr:hypothetical protein [Moritella viscosa]SGY93188.1 Putative uncharacterized protein [Moritella viscosa]SHO26605.1 Putative uncharacterized protein [Moritella viscosa]